MSHGPLIGGAALIRRLTLGEIFTGGTWTEDNVRVAKYDLRLSDRLLIVRNPGEADPLYVKDDERHTRRITIQPGGVAFVSTLERLKLPADVAANIGNKFEYIAQGVLMLNGLHVDPGYGLSTPEGKPLFFMLANTSSEPIFVKPRETVIGILQFLPVDQPGPVSPSESTSRADMIVDEFFSSKKPPLLGMSFFEKMAELERSHAKLETRFEQLERGARDLIQFGVLLVGATALVGFSVYLLQYVAGEGKDALSDLIEVLPRDIPRAALLLGILIFLSRLMLAPVAWWTGLVRGIPELSRWMWSSSVRLYRWGRRRLRKA